MTQHCLVPGCTNKVQARGLCNTHYSFAHNLVAVKGEITWETLEKEGKCLPTKLKHNTTRQWFYEKKDAH